MGAPGSSRQNPHWRFLVSRLAFCAFLAVGLLLCGILVTSSRQAHAHPLHASGAVPSVALSGAQTAMLGQSFGFTATFANAGDAIGYGPHIDLIFPVNGADGTGNTTPPADGIDFVSATYLGSSVTSVDLLFPGSGMSPTCVDHPYALDSSGTPLQVCGTPGDRLVVLRLPFGSFTPSQPGVVVTVNATLSDQADVDTALPIRARAGFMYGATALNDWCCGDPSIISPANTDSSAWSSTAITPTLFRLTKTYVGPENETSTGPNFPRQYRIGVTIAAGQTVTNLAVSDILPDNLQYVQVDSTSIRGTPVYTTTEISTPSTTVPGGMLTRSFAEVTGTGASNDAEMLVTYYVPATNASGAAVLDPTSGATATSTNRATVQGDWTPIDSRDSPTTVVLDPITPQHTLNDRTLAVQKGVASSAASNQPGTVLTYTVDFQISDYMALQSLVISDTLSDGQRLDPGYAPVLSVQGNGFTLAAAAVNGVNYAIDTSQIGNDTNPETDGSSTLRVRVSDEMVTRGQATGILVGACIPPAGGSADCGAHNAGSVSGTLVYRAVVQQVFSDSYLPNNSGVDEGDTLDNQVTITGNVLDNATLVPTGYTVSETSGTSVTVARGSLSKSIYAINGSTSFATPVKIKPGDTVTYRLLYNVPASDFEHRTFTDYLPLPVFSATEVTSFNVSATVPPSAGMAGYGPLDTFHLISGAPVPTMTVTSGSNSIQFDYGSFHDTASTTSKMDLLFTLTTSSAPFADGLYLTNQAHDLTGSTNAGTASADAIVDFQLTEPLLTFGKGIVATDSTLAVYDPAIAGPVTFNAPGTVGARWTGTIHSTNLAATPIESSVTGPDAGDHVTFALVIENQGSSANGAFDIVISDTVPSGYVVPAGGLNLRVAYGDGSAFPGDGSTVYTRPDGSAAIATDLLGSGIKLVDPGSDTGACQAHSLSSGKNILVLTYDLQVDSSVGPNQMVSNHAALSNYAGSSGGPNFLSAALTATSDMTTTVPSLSKTLVGSNQAHTSDPAVTVGEVITYALAITIPEGIARTVIVTDTLDAGLALVTNTVSASMPVSLTLSGGTTPSVANYGRTVVFNLGDVTNIDRDNTITETMHITYTAVVLNTVANVRGALRANSAVLTYADGSLGVVSAPSVTIVEPALRMTKSASPTYGDAGDVITYTLAISHTDASDADAFGVVLSDTIPVTMTFVPGSLTTASGTAPTDVGGGSVVTATWDSFSQAQESTIQFQVTLNVAVQPGDLITNTGNAAWTSLPGDVTTAQSAYDAVSTERTGNTSDPGGVANTYRLGSSRAINITTPVLTKYLAATSEAHTSDNYVAVGEIVRFRLAVNLPEGTSPNLQLRDNLPAGLTFLNDGSARVTFVSRGAGITSADDGVVPQIPCANLTGVVADPAILASSSITCTLADANVSTSATTNADSYTSGTDIYFKLGTVVNTESDLLPEYAVVEFNALVDNSPTGDNNAGETLVNNYDVSIAGSQEGARSGDVTLTVLEPAITVNAATKTVAPATGDAGDVVTYTIAYSNANGANNTTAFNVRITDTLPSSIGLSATSVSATSVASCATGVHDSTSGNAVDLWLDAVPTNCAVTITYTGTLQTVVTPTRQITNTARLSYTSLPGTNGTTGNATGSDTPGTSGTSTGERDGSGSPALNSYYGADTALVTVDDAALSKSIASTSEAHTAGTDVAIGEIVRYHLSVRIPEGTSPNFRITDRLPAGMLYMTGTAHIALVANAAGITSTAVASSAQASGNTSAVTPVEAVPGSAVTPATFADGTDPTFNLGDLVNSDSDSDYEYVVIEFNALVLNASGNTPGASLANDFQVRINGSAAITSNSTAVKVVQPAVTVTKSQLAPWPHDAGDLITYTLNITNASGTNAAAAFDTVVTDTLDSNLTYQTHAYAAPVTSTVTITTGQILTATVDQLYPGASAVITVTARVNDATRNGQVITNTAITRTTTLPSSGTPSGSGGNDTGSSTPGLSGAADGERVYTGTTGTVTVTLDTPAIAKSTLR